jgi:hypothetical protein
VADETPPRRRKRTRNVLGESSLALVKGDSRVVTVNMPLSEVLRLRLEAASLGVTLNEYIVALLNARRRGTRTKKKR